MKKVFLFIVLNCVGSFIISAQVSGKFQEFSFSDFSESKLTKQIYTGNFVTDSLKVTSNRFGVGYRASIGLLASLDLYALLRLPSTSYELSYGFVFMSKEGSKGYEGLGLKMMRQFSKIEKLSLSLYYFGAVYVYKGSEPPMDLLHFKGNVYLGLNAGIGSENFNGYFIEVGSLYLDKVFSPYFGAGKRYYF
jgi:hypothetical protein